MITIQKKPYLCSFTKNSIDFEVKTDMQYETSVVYPELVLLFKIKPTAGTTFNISFTNPESGIYETVSLVAVDGTDEINYQSIWQIPDDNFTGTLTELRNIVFEKLIQFASFNAFYRIEKPIIEFPGSTPRITITAKEAISELVIDWQSNQPTTEINKYISEANSVTYYQPGVRDGYELKASLFVENTYGSGNYSLVTTIDCILNENSIAYVDVSKYIDSEIESSWDEYPLPFERQLGYIAPNLRRYYVQFSETFSDQADIFTVNSEILYAHWGGASSDDQYSMNPVVSLNNSNQWLTWWPSGKRNLITQSDWLGWMNGASEITISINCIIKTNEREITENIVTSLTLNSFETYIFNTGFEANNFQDLLNEGEVLKFWSFSISSEELEILTEIYRYYPLNNCFTKQIVFFNSFGIPESFLISAEFQQNITTSQELAVRTQSFALNSKFPQNYIFDSKNVLSYNTETMMLSNSEADRLMPLLNSTITYLKENQRYVPVIINAGTTAVYKLNEFLQKIKIELARANENDRISYFETLPDFEIQNLVFTNGIQFCYLKRNLLNITDFGTIKIYKENEEIGEFTYNSFQNYYTGVPIIDEGLLTFILTCEVDGIQKIIRKQINYQWQKLTYELIYTGFDADIRFESYIPNAPMRIEWGDGIIENITLTEFTAFTKSFSTAGKKINRIFKPSYFDIISFVLLRSSNLFDVSSFGSLQFLVFEKCVAGNYYFTALTKLKNIIFIDTIVHQLNIGFQKDLENIILADTQISSENFEAFIKEIWLFRKSYTNNFVVQISEEVIISELAQSIIDGTDLYVGDGLNTYGITVIYL
jgi:hypothetical protein